MRKEQYNFLLEDLTSEENFKIVKEFSKDKETPFLVVDLAKVERKYDELIENMPSIKVYYAIKANPP